MRTIARQLLLLLALLAGLAPPATAQLSLPRGDWRTFETAHFRVHHPEPLDSVARRAAAHAETAHARLSAGFLPAPAGKIDLVVADFADAAGGAATGIFRRVYINVHPPLDERQLNHFDDWLELVITHELVHVFHGSRSGGVWKRLGGVFGLAPVTKMNAIASPDWLTEGLAVYYESHLTDAGRLRAAYYEMILRTAALEGTFFTLDRVTGAPTTWPGGPTEYIYGSHFVEHLVDRHGRARVSALVERFGSQTVPFRLDAAAKRVLGRSLADSWAEWSDSLRTHFRAAADSLRAGGLTEPEIVTTDGRYASFPRFSPVGGGFAYAASNGREPMATRVIAAGGAVRLVARRNTLGPTSWLPDGRGMVISQLSGDRQRQLADLYSVDLRGREVRLTRGARLLQPDVHPGGRRAVAVRGGGGGTTLVQVQLATGRVEPLANAARDVLWAFPRWSPAGDRIAVSRWRSGGFHDIVVLDATGAVLLEIPGGRVVATNPTWSPDGRYVLFSWDRSGISNLYAYDLERDTVAQVTSVVTGAFEPDVSPDGRWITFAYYQADGFHIARIPFDPALWRQVPLPAAAGAARATAAAAPGPAAAASRPYSALRSARPVLWSLFPAHEPGLRLGAGAYATSLELLGHHEYTAFVTAYRTGRVSAGASYGYLGFANAEVEVSLAQRWSSEQARRGSGSGSPADTAWATRLRREREAGVTARFSRPGLRTHSWLELTADARDSDFRWADTAVARSGAAVPERPLDVGAGFRVGYSSASASAFSVGSEDGFTAWAGAQARHFTAPLPGQAEATGYVRLHGGGSAFAALDLPGFARHSLGLHARAAADVGRRSPGIPVGGASGGASFPVRGYGNAVQEGDRAVSAQLEYRVPLALVERGAGGVPVFLDRVWGSAFVDAGTAWCSGTCDARLRPETRPAPLVSVGAELSARLVYLLHFPVTVRAGVALPLSEAAGASRGRPELYLGTSF